MNMLSSHYTAIYYEVYPGTSARWFPEIASLIFVKSDLYAQWKKDESSDKFENVLADPEKPVKFVWTDFSRKEGFCDNPPVSELLQWYQTLNYMKIAELTARNGYEITRNHDYLLKKINIQSEIEKLNQ